MLQRKCIKAECTVNETGICLDGHANPEECPNNVSDEDGKFIPDLITTEPNKEVATEKQTLYPLYAGYELGLEEAAEMMRKRYTYIVGVLGESNAGKTCLLISLYLLIGARQLLPRFQFAGSRSLQGFEDRARRLRTWATSGLIESFSERTQLMDPRRPAFLNIAIRDNDADNTYDWLFSDLPGEWTSEAIKRLDATDRLDFIRSADAIIYVVDGTDLEDLTKRHLLVHNTNTAFERIKELLGARLSVPFVVVISKGDKIGMKLPDAAAELTASLSKLGIEHMLTIAAAVSRDERVAKSGEGIDALIRYIVDRDNASAYPRGDVTLSVLNRSYWRGIS